MHWHTLTIKGLSIPFTEEPLLCHLENVSLVSQLLTGRDMGRDVWMGGWVFGLLGVGRWVSCHSIHSYANRASGKLGNFETGNNLLIYAINAQNVSSTTLLLPQTRPSPSPIHPNTLPSTFKFDTLPSQHIIHPLPSNPACYLHSIISAFRCPQYRTRHTH